MKLSSEVLFRSGLWQTVLEKYAIATGMTVSLYDAGGRAVLGPVHATPLFQLFNEKGYDPGIFAECAGRCLAQTRDRPAVVVSQVRGLAAVGTSLVLEGKVMGAAVGGYVFRDFSQSSEIQVLAREAGIAFDALWSVARKQQPVSQSRLTVHGELLQVLGDALLERDGLMWELKRSNDELTRFSDDVSHDLQVTKGELRALAASLMKAHEEADRRIARELHDDFTQRLSFLEMTIEQYQQGSIGKDRPEVERILALLCQHISQLAEDIRGLSHRMHPDILEHLGLAVALRSLAEESRLARSAPVHFTSEAIPHSLPLPYANAIYRIAQEALSNAMKHAPEAPVDITLTAEAGVLRLSVRDMGPGFDPAAAREKGGLGIVSMQERAHPLGADLQIDSRPGQGTTITLQASLPKEPRKNESAPAS